VGHKLGEFSPTRQFKGPLRALRQGGRGGSGRAGRAGAGAGRQGL